MWRQAQAAHTAPALVKIKPMTTIPSTAVNIHRGENFTPYLDPYSTSQKSTAFCVNHAPFLALLKPAGTVVIQACCNDWQCPRCGLIRAKQEYHRIVEGAEKLSETHQLYFVTITCKGAEMSLEDAEKHYLEWTNKLLTAWRYQTKKAAQHWCYVQVTERQQRGHPHSHFICTMCPDDAITAHDESGSEYLASRWFVQANVRVGLGSQCKLTAIRDAAAASRYVSKYLFKDSMFTRFPRKWKRVRYSRNYPKPLQYEVTDDVVILKCFGDWLALRPLVHDIWTDSHEAAHLAKRAKIPVTFAE